MAVEPPLAVVPGPIPPPIPEPLPPPVRIRETP
jgi:hypothetical protein